MLSLRFRLLWPQIGSAPNKYWLVIYLEEPAVYFALVSFPFVNYAAQNCLTT
jgi:hypothetical protein